MSLDEIKATYAKNIPAGRVGTPEDVAKTVVFLSTEAARVYVGQTIQPNGGEVRSEM